MSFVKLDIGGNLCWWTLNWAHAGHTVYTFEPLRSNVNLCAHSICENNFNDKIHLYNIGLSDRPQVIPTRIYFHITLAHNCVQFQLKNKLKIGMKQLQT